jgi:cellulose synthase/poly-beta-1,6-N-acetylglucosamine synthase-like glycosyltransferase
MNGAEMSFWLAAGFVSYTWAGYPLLMSLLARLRRRSDKGGAEERPRSVSIVLACFNEEANIATRLTDLAAQIKGCGARGEILVVSDGSADATAAIARTDASGLVRVIELPENTGKAHALSVGCAAARGEIAAFADARQRWDEQALARMLERFRDPRVGGVSGELTLEAQDGALGGVGLYWRMERWLRHSESIVSSGVGVTGAISAVRRELFRAIPRGTILDDVYWPMSVAMQGYRVAYEPLARAFDRLPQRPSDEFWRKARTCCGNYQLLCILPEALLPWRNPIWPQFVSHKVARLLAPWALVVMLVTSAVAYRSVFYLQIASYLLGIMGVSAAGGFVLLNAAAIAGFWLWISGRSGKAWRKASYAGAESSKLSASLTSP